MVAVKKEIQILPQKDADFLLMRMTPDQLLSFVKSNHIRIPNFQAIKKVKQLNPAIEKKIKLYLRGHNSLIKYIQEYIKFLKNGNFFEQFNGMKFTIEGITEEIESRKFENEKHKIAQENLILCKIIFENDTNLKDAYLDYLSAKSQKIEKETLEEVDEINELKERIRNLQAHLQRLDKENEDKKNKLNDQREYIKKLENEKDDLKETLKSHKNKIQNFQNEQINELKEELKEKNEKISIIKKLMEDEAQTLLDLTVYGSEDLIGYIRSSLNSEYIKINELEEGDLILFYEIDHSNKEKNQILENLIERKKTFIKLKSFEETQRWVEQLGGLKWKFNNHKTQILDILEK